jgi:hypothetical protein
MRLVLCSIFLLACASSAGVATAQTLPPRSRITAVAVVPAPVFVLPDATRTPLRTLPPGTRVKVLQERGDWYRVEFPDQQWGPRVGYVQRKHVELAEPETDTLETQPPVRPAPPDTPRTRKRKRQTRAWVEANVAVAVAGERDYSSIATRTLNGQPATFQADYHLPEGLAFDLGAGVMVTRQVGVGVTLGGTRHEDPAALAIAIPHPILLDAPASAMGETKDELRRSEGSLHIHADFVSALSDTLQVRVFGGPTYFRLQQDAVQDIRYDQQFVPFEPAHQVDITSSAVQRIRYADATGWGFHVGVDVASYLGPGIGVGVFGRYSRGTIDTREPLTGTDAEFDVGGFQGGGGLRIRF